MARLFKKHPMSIFLVIPSDQGVLDLGQRTFDRLGKVAFESIDDNSMESSVGVVTLEDYRSTEFGPGNVEFGSYVVGAIRIDARKVPKSALDKLFEDMLDTEKAQREADEDGTVHISRDRRTEIREQAALKLRAQVPPTIKVVDFFWNRTTGLAFLTDKSKVAVEAFVAMFNCAFGPAIELRQMDVTDILPGADNSDINTGQDFLTWMWGLRDKNSAFLAGGMAFSAYITDQVEICDNHKTLTAKFDDDTTEIDTGVKLGLRVSKALIKIEYGEENEHWCTFLLSSGLFPILEVSIPNAKFAPGTEFEGALLQQIGTLEEAFTRLHLLLVCYAVQHRPEVIAKGLSQGELADILEAPDTMSGYLEEGQTLVSVRDVHFITKPFSPPVEEEAA